MAETALRPEEIRQLCSRFALRKLAGIFLLLLAVLVLAVAAASVGAASVGIREVLLAILGKFFPVECGRLARIVVWQMRLPRILMAFLAGAGLAVSGTAMQGILRNLFRLDIGIAVRREK